MSNRPSSESQEAGSLDHVDVLIVGAGISGIGAACHLQTLSPDRTYTIIEGRDSIGGTWDLFRYPGVRSDSDMHTLGYSFKPWKAEKAIADGPSILAYLTETVEENGIGPHIRFNHLATSADWSSDTHRWTIMVSHAGEERTITANFLFMCSGYYSYKGGHDPEFAGRDDFTGQVVHPQQWPEELDYDGKDVVIIGSGATAVTLLPAMADTAASVTMLQRSPTYMVAGPSIDPIANGLRRVLPDRLAYDLTRRKNVALGAFFYRRTRTRPAAMKKLLLKGVRKQLGDVVDIETDFTPTYDPWDQRVCMVPDGDLFDAIKSGRGRVVTDTIDRFTATGIRLASGEELPADVIVTATGLQLVTLGEMEVSVDGEIVDFSKTVSYKGLAYSGVPNLVSSFGYINASWTLRADLTCEYVCRLLNHMAETGTTSCTPTIALSDVSMERRPYIDGFSAGYIQRALHQLPSQGDRAPWLNTQSYSQDKKLFRDAPVDDGSMIFR